MPAKGPTAERLAKAQRVRGLKRSGRTWRQITDELGLSTSYARELYDDPEGKMARARKDSYSQPCPGCGAPLSGANGPNNLPALCATCGPAAQHEGRWWTPERIVESFRAFYAATGVPPSATNAHGLTPSQSCRLSAERLAEIERAPKVPHTMVVRREFGSWSAALRASGFEPSRGGEGTHRGARRLTDAAEETLTLIRSGVVTAAELADARGLGLTSVHSITRTLIRKGLVARDGGGRRNDPYRYRIADGAPQREGGPMAREFVVLHKNGKGWVELEVVEAPTPEIAVERIASAPGEYRAVPLPSWRPLNVGEVTKLAVIAE